MCIYIYAHIYTFCTNACCNYQSPLISSITVVSCWASMNPKLKQSFSGAPETGLVVEA